MEDLKTFDQYLSEARAELVEGKDNVNTSDKQKNPQPEGDPNKDGLTNPETDDKI
jgi:hypothetical protein